MTKLISVLLLNHNYERYLERAIESVLAQDFEDYELILLDDGSTDGSDAIARKYASRIDYVRQSHAGAFMAARAAIKRARSKWVLFLDADDELRPGALRHLADAARSHPGKALILGSVCNVDEATGRTFNEPPVDLSESALDNFSRFCRGLLKAPIAGGLVDRSLLLEFDDTDPDYPISMDLAVLAVGITRGCAQIDELTLNVHAHEGSLRNDVRYIDRSGLRLADFIFDERRIGPEYMRLRSTFVALLQRERARSYYRARWYSASWPCYVASVRAAPEMLADVRNMRRFVVSLAKSLYGADEGPVAEPPGHWLLGHRRSFHGDPVGFSKSHLGDGRKLLRVRDGTRSYVTANRHDVTHMLTKNPENYQPAGIARAFPIFRDSILGTLHPEHAAIRRRFARFFNPASLDRLFPVIADSMNGALDREQAGSDADLFSLTRETLKSVSSVILFGETDRSYVDRLDDAIMVMHQRACRKLRPMNALSEMVSPRNNRIIGQKSSEIANLVAELVAKPDRAFRHSILDQLLADREAAGAESSSDIANDVASLYLAALEPVAITAAAALFRLGQDDLLQAKIAEEIASFNAGPSPGVNARDDLKKYSKLNSYIDEIHRLYPAEWMLSRQVRNTERLPSGFLARRGSKIMIDLHSLQRNAEIFPDPDRLLLGRFDDGKARKSGCYIPFGAGITSCLGLSLSRILIGLFLIGCIGRWRITAPQGEIPLTSYNLFSFNIAGDLPGALLQRQK